MLSKKQPGFRWKGKRGKRGSEQSALLHVRTLVGAGPLARKGLGEGASCLLKAPRHLPPPSPIRLG